MLFTTFATACSAQLRGQLLHAPGAFMFNEVMAKMPCVCNGEANAGRAEVGGVQEKEGGGWGGDACLSPPSPPAAPSCAASCSMLWGPPGPAGSFTIPRYSAWLALIICMQADVNARSTSIATGRQ